MAAAAGYRKVELRLVRDRNQVPVFEVFRIELSFSPMSIQPAALNLAPAAP
jgi:hypothetical protein